MIRLDSLSIGLLIALILSQQKISELEFDKETLLDFNEKLIRDRDEIEQRYTLTSRGYIAHLDTHECKRKEDRLVEMKTKNLGMTI